jgi:iron(III) transport system substrate-binding protein
MIRRIISFPLFFLLFALCRAADLPAADDKTVELARKEGRVSFYTSMAAEESKLLADAFQSKYPVLRVEISRLSSEKLLQRNIPEHRAGSSFQATAAEAAIKHTSIWCGNWQP